MQPAFAKAGGDRFAFNLFYSDLYFTSRAEADADSAAEEEKEADEDGGGQEEEEEEELMVCLERILMPCLLQIVS